MMRPLLARMQGGWLRADARVFDEDAIIKLRGPLGPALLDYDAPVVRQPNGDVQIGGWHRQAAGATGIVWLTVLVPTVYVLVHEIMTPVQGFPILPYPVIAGMIVATIALALRLLFRLGAWRVMRVRADDTVEVESRCWLLRRRDRTSSSQVILSVHFVLLVPPPSLYTARKLNNYWALMAHVGPTMMLLALRSEPDGFDEIVRYLDRLPIGTGKTVRDGANLRTSLLYFV